MKETIEKTFTTSLTPTSSTDYIRVGVKQEDNGVVMLRLASALPDGEVIENHRTVMQREVAKNLANILCNSLDYFPRKRKKTARKK